MLRKFSGTWNIPPYTILTRAGLLRDAKRAGPGVFDPLPLTRLLGHVVTRGKRHSKEHKKSFINCFRNSLGQVNVQVTKGHQRSNFADFNIFFYKSAYNSGTRGATALHECEFDISFNVLFRCPQIWPKINGSASRKQKFYKKRFW